MRTIFKGLFLFSAALSCLPALAQAKADGYCVSVVRRQLARAPEDVVQPVLSICEGSFYLEHPNMANDEIDCVKDYVTSKVKLRHPEKTFEQCSQFKAWIDESSDIIACIKGTQTILEKGTGKSFVATLAPSERDGVLDAVESSCKDSEERGLLTQNLRCVKEALAAAPGLSLPTTFNACWSADVRENVLDYASCMMEVLDLGGEGSKAGQSDRACLTPEARAGRQEIFSCFSSFRKKPNLAANRQFDGLFFNFCSNTDVRNAQGFFESCLDRSLGWSGWTQEKTKPWEQQTRMLRDDAQRCLSQI